MGFRKLMQGGDMDTGQGQGYGYPGGGQSHGMGGGQPRDLRSVHMGDRGGLLGGGMGALADAQPGGMPPGGPQPGGADRYKMNLLRGAIRNYAPTNAPQRPQMGGTPKMFG
jgi:hypothetical protein